MAGFRSRTKTHGCRMSGEKGLMELISGSRILSSGTIWWWSSSSRRDILSAFQFERGGQESIQRVKARRKMDGGIGS